MIDDKRLELAISALRTILVDEHEVSINQCSLQRSVLIDTDTSHTLRTGIHKAAIPGIA